MLSYLKTLYPNATDLELEYYLSLIENYEQDKLPATAEIVEFIQLKKAEKDLEERLETLRAKVIDQRRGTGHKFQLVNITEIESKKFHPQVFYDWVSSLVSPEILEELTIKTINERKFIQLEAKGVIQYESIPKECFTAAKSWRIDIGRSRKGNKDLDL